VRRNPYPQVRALPRIQHRCPQSSAVRSIRERPVRDPYPSPRLRRCAGGSSPCSAPRRATLWMICSPALVRSAGPRAPTPASSRPLRPQVTRRGRAPADASSPAANDTCDRRLRPHTNAYAQLPPELLGDRPHFSGDGPVPWPGSLPGPWFLARVLLEAQCQGWPEAISEGNAKRP
jgi:hypothetical protein